MTFSRKHDIDDRYADSLSRTLTSISLNRLRKFMEYMERLVTRTKEIDGMEAKYIYDKGVIERSLKEKNIVKMCGYNRFRIIEALAKIPSEVRTDAFITQIERLRAKMNSHYTATFIETLANVSLTYIPRLLEQVEYVMATDIKTYDFLNMASTIADKAIKCVSITIELAKIPPEVRTDAFIAQVKRLTAREGTLKSASIIAELAARRI